MSADATVGKAKRRGRHLVAFILTTLLALAAALLTIAWQSAVSAYPESRSLPGGGLRAYAACPTYGARVGSIRSPLCVWEFVRYESYQSASEMFEVYSWYREKDRRWSWGAGRWHILLRSNDVQPLESTPAGARFSVEGGILIEIAQD